MININTPEDLLENLRKEGAYIIGLKDYKSTYHYLVNRDVWNDFSQSKRGELGKTLKHNYDDFNKNYNFSESSLIHYELDDCNVSTCIKFIQENNLEFIESCEVYE